jgi:hypothetical protein
MPSDIYIKNTSGTGSTTWKKLTNLFIKSASGTGSTAWKTATAVWVYFNSSFQKVWPLSGVFSVTSPYITTSSGSTTPLYAVDGVRRIGTTVWGKNGTWNANGWTINSYQYKWKAYTSSDLVDSTVTSETALTTYSSAVSLSLPTTYDRTYLSFYIQANSSGGTAYNGYAESGTEYGRIQIVRSSPLNLTTSLSSYSPKVGTQITYSSTWDETDRYAAESYRTNVYWYRNSSNSTSGGTYIGSGTTYTPTSSDLGYYLYVVETRYNSGSDYDLGLNTGVEAKIITTSTVVAGLTPPTSVSIASVSRYNNTQTIVNLNHSGGSGPYYQLYWIGYEPAPETANYDAASNSSSSSISEAYQFATNTTYYFYVRSSSENIATTFTNGTATAGTYSSWSNIAPNPFYTFQHPSGSVSVFPSSGDAGVTTFTATPSISASPTADISYQWQYLDQGSTYINISGETSSTYSPPSNYFSLGYTSSIRCLVTANNGVSSSISAQSFQTTGSATVTAPVRTTNVARRVTMPSSFTNSSQTIWVGTNGYVSVTVDPTTSPGTTWPTAGGIVVGPGVSDLIQTSLSYKADSSNFYVYWKGYRLGDTSKELWYLMKFYWNSTTVDVYFERYTLTDGSLDAVRFGNSQYSTWANSTSISTFSIPTGMTSNTTNDGQDDNRTAITATKPLLNLTTNPAYGTATSTSGGWTASITTSPNPTGGTYSVISTTAGSASVNSSTGALTASGLSSGQSSTVTVRYSLSGYNSVDITKTGSASVVVSAPSGGSVTLSGNNTPGSVITASTSGWTNSPTSYDVYITTALSPNIPTSSSSRVASSGGGSSTTYTITASDAVSPVNIFRAFATASNAGGTGGPVQSSNTITASAGSPATAPGTPGTPTNGWTSGTSYPFSWTAPSAGTVTGGGAATITGYTMRIYEATSSSGTGSYLLTTLSLGSGTSYTYTSPNASLYYAASVAATNSAGLTGSYSGISAYK